MDSLALVSGGKDSICALCAAKVLGFDIKVLGHIRHDDGNVERDSYMYQTVGSGMGLIEGIAECLNIPLLIQSLEGNSVDLSLDYKAPVDGDEVEDLHNLLLLAKSKYPNLKFVINGAIQSDYQRNRVENVCSRLSLVSVSPLWNISQKSLLSIMCATPRLEVVLVKVAAMGLSVDMLGTTLTQAQRALRDAAAKFGCQCCGEGGEFESVVMDCPMFTTKKLEVETWRKVIVTPDDAAPVAYAVPETPVKIVARPEREFWEGMGRHADFPAFCSVVMGDFFSHLVVNKEFFAFCGYINRALDPTSEVEIVRNVKADDLLKGQRLSDITRPKTITLRQISEDVHTRFAPSDVAIKSAAFLGIFPWGELPPSPQLSIILAFHDMLLYFRQQQIALTRLQAIEVYWPEDSAQQVKDLKERDDNYFYLPHLPPLTSLPVPGMQENGDKAKTAPPPSKEFNSVERWVLMAVNRILRINGFNDTESPSLFAQLQSREDDKWESVARTMKGMGCWCGRFEPSVADDLHELSQFPVDTVAASPVDVQIKESPTSFAIIVPTLKAV